MVQLAQLSTWIGDQSHFVVQYLKFDDPKAGNFMKDRRLCDELKECAPITARAKRFPLKKGKVLSLLKENNF